nr:glycoside hydrolase family 2 TIM barrel-domain containing protein [uncultured Lacibacter sp.]
MLTGFLYAQPGAGTTVNLNKNWLFTKETKTTTVTWEPVQLPHTWNTDDVMDDVPGYYRGAGLYKRKLFVDKKRKGKQIYLLFEGANQVTEVFINGKKAGEHTGGYSAFSVAITEFVEYGKENELVVKVDNSFNQDIPPLSADFTFYGGIYRDVWMKVVDAVHFSMNDHATAGIYISTPIVNAKLAEVHVRSLLANESKTERRIRIKTIVKNRAGQIVTTASQLHTLLPGRTTEVQQTSISVKQPILWSPESPYLYTVVSEIKDAVTGALLDVVKHPLGLRWFHFDAAKGFFLNGKSYKLVGTSRHQDYQGLGNAVPDRLAVKDMLLLKKMGGNFLRVAHYPQDPAVLAACDSLGILASVEIPVVNEISETDAFYNNCLNMQVEMIRQHYNHPSVIIWCYMNEVLLRPHYNNDKVLQQVYFSNIRKLAQSLDSVTRKEDPYRYTMIAHHGDYKRYNETGLNNIAMIVGWNLYSGWYGPDMTGFPAFLDAFHKNHPQTPVVVSEYGADADPRIRSKEPVRFDKSVEYTTKLHQYYYTEMMKRPFVAAAMIWNLADFNSETRTETMPHINNKGLLEWNRTAKDPYYYYQTMLSEKPAVKILGPSVITAVADSSNEAICTWPVQVAANSSEMELIINGTSAGKKKTTDGLCEWLLPIKNGRNKIEVKGTGKEKTVSDTMTLMVKLLPIKIDAAKPFQPMNILLGGNRFFTDDEGQQWVPDQPYKKGSWGSIGGKAFKIPGNGRLPYGTDKNIAATGNDPVYQTQQTGIKKYCFDVPDAVYELTLHFAELLGGQVKELPYNLADPERIEPNGKRIFHVYVNGKLLLDNVDITAQYGAATAVQKKVNITVSGNTGIEIEFRAVEGEPVLNAVQLKKIN